MITMSDIARLSGYSRSTVSAVLRGKTTVSPRARGRILAVVEEHHYKPNFMARALVGKVSNLVGVVLRDLKNPYFHMLMEGIEQVLSAAGYDILYFNTRENHRLEMEVMQRLSAYQVAGVILSPVLKGVDLEHIRVFSQNQTPLITLEKIQGFAVDHVAFKDEQGGYLAGQHLLSRGHRRLVYLAGPETSLASEQRLIGLRRALAEAGVAWDEAAMLERAGATSAGGYAAAQKVLARPRGQRPTGVFCFNDVVAMGLYKAASGAGVMIPRQLSVVGFDDIEMAALLGPALTTVSFGIEQVGRTMATELLGQIRDKKAQRGFAKVLSPRLMQRDSVAAVAGGE